MKDAQIWEIPGKKTPIVKIEYTLYYDMKYGAIRNADASIMWNGVKKPKGAKMLAMIKVEKNDSKHAMWALNRWLKGE